jgi:hypothetical protein
MNPLDQMFQPSSKEPPVERIRSSNQTSPGSFASGWNALWGRAKVQVMLDRQGRKEVGTAASALVLCLASGCGFSNDEAHVNQPSGALAVGAYHNLRFSDACRGGGKLNVCTTEGVMEVHPPQSSDPGVVEPIESADHPMADVLRDPYYLVGRGVGEATLHVEGDFDDGSTRSVDFNVEVKRITKITTDVSCAGGDPVSEVFVPLGWAHSGFVNLIGGGELLVGWLPDAVEGDGVEPFFSDDNRTRFTWPGLKEPGTVEVRAPLTDAVVAKLHAYGPEDVTKVELTHRNSPPVRMSSVGEFYMDSFVLIGTARPCRSIPVTFHTDTPEICSGSDAAEVWPGDSDFGGPVTANAEGICKLGASMDGTKVLGRLDFPLFMVEEVPLEVRPGFGNPCSVEGSTTCAGQIRGLCFEGRWITDEHCPEDQTCDLVPNTRDGCVGDGPCSTCRSLLR